MKKLPKKITLEWLKQHNACRAATALFREMFPKGTPLTIEVLERFARRFAARANTREAVVSNWFIWQLELEHSPWYECWCFSYRNVYATLRKLGVPER